MQEAVPAHGVIVSWGSRRETEGRVGGEDSSTDEAQSVESDEHGSPRPTGDTAQRTREADGCSDGQQSGADEEGDMHPTPISVGHQAQVMSCHATIPPINSHRVGFGVFGVLFMRSTLGDIPRAGFSKTA